MNNIVRLNRRNFFYASSLIMTGLIQSCATKNQNKNQNNMGNTPTINSQQTTINSKPISKDNDLYIFAPSGFASDMQRSQLALTRLTNAGFYVSNYDCMYRQFQRFAGTDEERINDLQNIVTGNNVPKILIGLRGGYGAIRLLPYINWEALGSKLKENQTLVMGFSDICVIELALLAKSNMSSFSGPMVYSDFGLPTISFKTMQNFINATTNPNLIINIDYQLYMKDISISGISWGGNLSILSALAGSSYLPNIPGGILFIEDVGEQPYKIERMLQTLYLAGVLQVQSAIVLGQFRMDKILDIYDSSYNLYSVINNIRRVIKIPIFLEFPFGHIADMVTFPLGVPCTINITTNGYSVKFSNYPTLNRQSLNLDSLLSNFEEEYNEDNIENIPTDEDRL